MAASKAGYSSIPKQRRCEDGNRVFCGFRARDGSGRDVRRVMLLAHQRGSRYGGIEISRWLRWLRHGYAATAPAAPIAKPAIASRNPPPTTSRAWMLTRTGEPLYRCKSARSGNLRSSGRPVCSRGAFGGERARVTCDSR